MKQTLIVLLIISLAPSATAETQFTRVLLPITTETVPGANGSLWESELWVHASSDEGATILPLSLSDLGPLKHISLVADLRGPRGTTSGSDHSRELERTR